MSQRFNTGNADLMDEKPLGRFPVSSALSLLSSHLCLDFHAFLLADRLKLRVWDFFQGPELFKIFPSADGPVRCIMWWFLCLAINENHPGNF